MSWKSILSTIETPDLDKCKVCIPENYDILFNSSSIDINAQKILKDVLLKSDYLDKKKCEENNGKFLELNEKKIITLIKKSEKYKTSEEVLYPKSKYNAFYLECQKKLKDTYFDNLNHFNWIFYDSFEESFSTL